MSRNWNNNRNNNYNNNSNYQNGNNNNNSTPAKKSGATYSKINKGNFEGEIIINAWRKTKFGLMTCTVSPYNGKGNKGKELVTSTNRNTGEIKEYIKMIAVVKNTSLGTSQLYPVLMNLKTKVIVLQELSLCITPNGRGQTASGKMVTGYFGRNFKK